MKMNLPNRLTILRVILVPFFVLFMLLDMGITGQKYIALGIFVVASLTDTADGYIARKYHLITNFGKFMDPLADKLLVCSALICFVDLGRMPTWIVLIIIAREFIISGFRLVASDQGLVLAASWWGKSKTICQMITVIVLIAAFPGQPMHVVEQVLIYLSLALTVISLMDYLIKNRSVLTEQKDGNKK